LSLTGTRPAITDDAGKTVMRIDLTVFAAGLTLPEAVLIRHTLNGLPNKLSASIVHGVVEDPVIL
jgi:hypothetical protein